MKDDISFEDGGNEILMRRYERKELQLKALKDYIDRNWQIGKVTLTKLLLMRKERNLQAFLNFCMLRAAGKWQHPNGEEYEAMPAMLSIVELRSLRMSDDGRHLPVPYKTGQESNKNNTSRVQTITASPQTDPETGIFRLTLDEAIKVLRHYGREVVSHYRYPLGARMNDRTGEKITDKPRGDRWMVEEVAHLYTDTGTEEFPAPLSIG